MGRPGEKQENSEVAIGRVSSLYWLQSVQYAGLFSGRYAFSLPRYICVCVGNPCLQVSIKVHKI